jgi:hypothetical protein
MSQRHRAFALALALIAITVVPAITAAGIGDSRNVTGHISMWGANYFGRQIAIVQDDEGQAWIVRFEPGTLPEGAAVGTEIALVGYETFRANEIDVVAAQLTASVSALPAGAASGWAVVPGAVQDASGTLAVIRANGGTVVTVDTSQLDADARTWLTPGRGVTVVGVYRQDGVLAARGVATATP